MRFFPLVKGRTSLGPSSVQFLKIHGYAYD